MELKTGTSESEGGKSIGDWFSSQTGRPVCPPYAAMGWIDEEGEYRAAVLFNDYNGANIEAHVWARGELQRHMIGDVFNYVFLKLKCLRLTAKPYRVNRTIKRFLERIGFEYECTLKNYYGQGRANDALVMRLEPAAAERWMNDGTL